MKNIACIAAVAFLSLVLSAPINAQSVNVSQERYCSINGLYCVTLPALVDVGGGGPLDEEFFEGFGNSYTSYWQGIGLYVLTSYLYFNEDGEAVAATERDKLLAEAIVRVKRMIAKETGTDQIIERRSTVNKVAVTDLSVQGPNGELVYRLTTCEKGIILLKSIFSNVMKPTAMRFLDSLETPGIEAIVNEKLKDATPAPLPECDAKFSMVSDLKQEHLAGNVRSISVEREETEDGKTKRGLRLVQEYDQLGRLAKEVEYEDTFRPEYVRIFGCIDGKRVVKVGDVVYEDRLTAYGPPRPGAKPRDNRYSSMFEFKLDEKGRIAEKLIYGNDSLVYTTEKYIYGNNKLEIASTDFEGDETERQVMTFGADGRITSLIKSTYSSGEDKYEWRHTNKFVAFDQKGNWTKRTGIYEFFKNGKLDRTSTYTEYRTITYYK